MSFPQPFIESWRVALDFDRDVPFKHLLMIQIYLTLCGYKTSLDAPIVCQCINQLFVTHVIRLCKELYYGRLQKRRTSGEAEA